MDGIANHKLVPLPGRPIMTWLSISLFLAGLAIFVCSAPGCETRVIQDNSVDARLGRSMPAGNLQNGRGGSYQPRQVSGKTVPPSYIPNAAVPGTWAHGFSPPTGQ